MTITIISKPLRATMDRETVTCTLSSSQLLLWSGRALLGKRENLNPRHQRKISDTRTPLHTHKHEAEAMPLATQRLKHRCLNILRGTEIIEWISLYRKGIYKNDLQVAVQSIQPWLAVNGKSKNPLFAQSTRLDVSVGLQFMPESLRSRL